MSKTDIVDAAFQPVLARQAAPQVKLNNLGDGLPRIKMTSDETYPQMLATFATGECNFATRMLTDLMAASGGSKTPDERECNELLSVVHGIAPRDGVEAMLAVQMATAHVAIVRSARRLRGSETIVQQDSNSNMLNKLMRTFTAQVETLSRYRNAGQQQVVVKHVQVNAAQAVVGIDMTDGGVGEK